MPAIIAALDDVGIVEAIALLQEALDGAGVVIFPTETVYGIAARVDMPGAIQRIFEIKSRPSAMPLPVMVPTKQVVYEITDETDERFERLTEFFWPGPLTIVLKKNQMIDRLVTGGGETVAVRIPSHELPFRLLQSLPIPLAVSSANISGDVTSPESIVDQFEETVDVIITGDATRYAEPSTVVDLTTPVTTILRPGAVERSRIDSCLRGISTI